MCGAFYGQVIATTAHSGALSGSVNPGVLHQGFSRAEAFPGIRLSVLDNAGASMANEGFAYYRSTQRSDTLSELNHYRGSSESWRSA